MAPRHQDGIDGGGIDLSSLLPTLMMMNRQSSSAGGDMPWIQMLLALLLPLFIRLFTPKLQNCVNSLRMNRNYATRTIACTKETGVWRWWDDKEDEDAFNTVVQKAILTFINKELPHVAKAWKESDVQAVKEDRTISGAPSASELSSRNDDDDGSSTTSSSLSSSGAYASYTHYSYLCAPPEGVWVDLKNGIELERVISDNNGGNQGESRKGRHITTTFTLRSKCWRKGPKELNKFIDQCVDAYNAELRSKVDSSRYMYQPIVSAASTEGASDKAKGSACMLYKQYKLSEARTFSSFFHPDKASVLALVDQFTAKRGKFSIPGYPQKLGFLLHGPPGTGKTSFIKALAQYTNRHIVNIPLSKVKTNQELMNIMFDQKILLSGSEDNTSVPLPHSRVIFVMEDIDAASSVVQRREPAASANTFSASTATTAAETMMVAAAIAASTASSSSSSSSTSVEVAGSGSGTGCDGAVSGSGSASTSNSGGGDFGIETLGGGSSIGPLCLSDLLKGSAADNDKLNLAALLNVLDGVIDTPDRIVVMTSNHPEKLDPALIRPGRINRKLYLGNVKLSEATSMMRHYFSAGNPLPASIESRLAEVFVDDLLSPAQVESMCAEFDNPEEMIDALAAKLVSSFQVGGCLIAANSLTKS